MNLYFVCLELMTKYLLARITRELGPEHFDFVGVFNLHDVTYIFNTIHLIAQKIMWLLLLYDTIIFLIII